MPCRLHDGTLVLSSGSVGSTQLSREVSLGDLDSSKVHHVGRSGASKSKLVGQIACKKEGCGCVRVINIE